MPMVFILNELKIMLHFRGDSGDRNANFMLQSSLLVYSVDKVFVANHGCVFTGLHAFFKEEKEQRNV